ncbi:MAG: sulfur carrier protein ThiS [Pseudomonadota bacterium]|nr:sulfur carrier protein ThiS [Pseudomonadota bacterium]
MSQTFEIYINNVPCEVKPNMSLSEILNLFGAQQPYALLFNRTFLPSSKHESIQLKPDDRIEVISAIQGG